MDSERGIVNVKCCFVQKRSNCSQRKKDFALLDVLELKDLLVNLPWSNPFDSHLLPVCPVPNYLKVIIGRKRDRECILGKIRK